MTRTIRELSIEYHEKKEGNRTIVYGAVDRGKLKEVSQQMMEHGRIAMAPFITWYIEKRGVEPAYAERIALTAWTVLWETENDYMSKVMDPDLTRTAYGHIVLSLRMLAVYLTSTPGRSQEEREFGRKIYNDIAVVKTKIKSLYQRRIKNPPSVCKPTPPNKQPYTDGEIELFLEGIEAEFKVTGHRYPWHKVILRILITTGIQASDLMHISKVEIARVYREHSMGKITGLALWKKGKRVRVVPSSLMAEELATLAHWPFEYGTLGDIVSPLSRVNQRASSGARRATQHLKYLILKVLEEDKLPPNYMAKIRYAAMRRVFLATGKDWITLAQIYGMKMESLRGYPFLQDL